MAVGDVEIATPPRVRVRWDCTRCGFVGGEAQTTFPIEPTYANGMWPTMVAQLRKKLVRVHQRANGCIALPDDFRIRPWS